MEKLRGLEQHDIQGFIKEYVDEITGRDSEIIIMAFPRENDRLGIPTLLSTLFLSDMIDMIHKVSDGIIAAK